jgi:hypothetical protein
MILWFLYVIFERTSATFFCIWLMTNPPTMIFENVEKNKIECEWRGGSVHRLSADVKENLSGQDSLKCRLLTWRLWANEIHGY